MESAYLRFLFPADSFHPEGDFSPFLSERAEVDPQYYRFKAEEVSLSPFFPPVLGE